MYRIQHSDRYPPLLRVSPRGLREPLLVRMSSSHPETWFSPSHPRRRTSLRDTPYYCMGFHTIVWGMDRSQERASWDRTFSGEEGILMIWCVRTQMHGDSAFVHCGLLYGSTKQEGQHVHVHT